MTAPATGVQPTPGSEEATSGAACTKETPCFVCKLKKLVGSDASQFSDQPFAINVVGCRLAHRVTDIFDDRLIFFFALPTEESRKALTDAKIETDLIKAINDAASELNKGNPPDGAKLTWRSVRRVACSSIELESGKPVTGHRVVAMIPITTDPGLVRVYKTHQKNVDEADNAMKAAQANLKALQEAKLKYAAESKKLKEGGEELKKWPPPKKKGEAETPERIGAATKCAEATVAINGLIVDLKKQLKWEGKITGEKLDKWIDTQTEAQNKIEAAKKNTIEGLTKAWESDLTPAEQDNFDYRYAFRNENGDMEGDDHAYFPLGHHANFFTLHLHHWNRNSAMPALIVGEYLGERVITGRVLKKDFRKLMVWPRSQRIAQATNSIKETKKVKMAAFEIECKAEAKALDTENQNAKATLIANQKNDRKTIKDAKALKAFDNTSKAAITDLDKTHKQAKADLLARQNEKRTNLLKEINRPVDEAANEYLALAGIRKSANPPPASARIALGCEVKTSDSIVPLADDDEFVIKGDTYGRRSGKDIRLHYHGIKEKSEADLTIIEHHPAAERHKLPEGSTIVAKEPMYESGGTLKPIGDDDVLLVEAMIGGTNIHRGHNLVAENNGSLAPNSEKLNKVGNWSTGCQVVPYFDDYNLFILLCGLSKRWQCLREKKASPSDCPHIETGSASAPDPFVWEHTLTKSSFPTKALTKKIQDATVILQKDIKTAQENVSKKTDAWYKDKAQKDIRRPKESPAAEATMAATYEERVKNLSNQLEAEKSANAQADAAGGVKTDAEKAARAKADEAWKERDLSLQTLKKEQQEFKDAITKRNDLIARLNSLESVNDELKGCPNNHSFLECEQWLTALRESLDKDLKDASHFDNAPEAKDAAENAKKAIDDTITEMKETAYLRAVKMRHDWMRTCDLASNCKKKGAEKCKSCGERFSYTLIELDEKNATAEFQSIVALDNDFTKKVWRDDTKDAYPLWSGFGT